MHLVQVWALPGIPLQELLRLGPEPIVTLKSVKVQPPGGAPILATLLETNGTREHMSEAPDVDMRRLGTVLSRLSFGLLHPFSVFSARLIPKGLKTGEEMEEIVFPGPPPGIALFEGKIGFQQQTVLDPSFLVGELPPNVDGAITWFLNGNFAANSVQQVICHWIGLEMLAPLVTGPWRCTHCGADFPECPSCHETTEAPRTVETIREFLEKNLGVDRKEYKQLYDLRCNISHGRLAMDPEGIEVASKKAARIQQLLLQAIKQALNWPVEAPPNIKPEGFTIVGVPALVMKGVVPDGDFYSQPGVYPG
jgi:hypothetical protein